MSGIEKVSYFVSAFIDFLSGDFMYFVRKKRLGIGFYNDKGIDLMTGFSRETL